MKIELPERKLPRKSKDFNGKTQIPFTIRMTPEIFSQIDILRSAKNESMNKTCVDLIECGLKTLKGK